MGLAVLLCDYLQERERWDPTNHCTKLKLSIKDFFSKSDQMWPHLLKKFLMENFIFCAMNYFLYGVFDQV